MHSLTCAHCGEKFESVRRRKFCCVTCRNRANNEARSKRLAEMEPVVAWGCGGGVDSTAIAALIVAGELPKPDLAYMTDCGWERARTWDYVREVTRPRLESAGVRLQIIKTADYADNRPVSEDGFVYIPAYRYTPDGVVKFRTCCNNNWKVRPAMRWLRDQGVERCENWIGISADESRRVRSSRLKWVSFRYPLIELGMSREDALWFLAQHGWPRPHRTSCVICPNQSDEQWREVRACRQDWDRVLRVERAIQRKAGDVYLHSSAKPIERAIEW